jgi:hypothetical protein
MTHMSDLSERDKEILLGQGRTTDPRIEALQENDNTPEKRLTACEGRTMSAVFLAITGVALLIGGFVLNGTHFGFEKSLGALLLAAGIAWYLYLRMTINKLRASGVQPG